MTSISAKLMGLIIQLSLCVHGGDMSAPVCRSAISAANEVQRVYVEAVRTDSIDYNDSDPDYFTRSEGRILPNNLGTWAKAPEELKQNHLFDYTGNPAVIESHGIVPGTSTAR